MTPPYAYRAEPVLEDTTLADIRLIFEDGKTWHMLGRGGAKREGYLLRAMDEQSTGLPVLLGAGLGHALAQLVERKLPVCVVDAELPILERSNLREQYKDNPDVVWITESDPRAVLGLLTRWQMHHQGAPLVPLLNPIYSRLNPELYGQLQTTLKASSSFDFWSRTRYAKFQSWPPRILMVTSQYFLMGEVVSGCERMGVPHKLVQIANDEKGTTEFVETLLEAVLSFKPDFVFTINHLGVDREGVLVDLLERMELPLASWFVDNPHLILYLYNRLVSPTTAIFTWDTDNIQSLKELGFEHVHYLPLGTDVHRFVPPADGSSSRRTAHPLHASISFVGNSMQYKVGHRMKAGQFTKPLLTGYKTIARQFADSKEHSVRQWLAAHAPDRMKHFEALPTDESRLAYEAMITWEATRQYRKSCVEGILDHNPLIVGDKGWHITFRHEQRPWRYHRELGYYDDLPWFYPLADINFNCTSKQMKGAVNQRVFDVPATNSFVLTDWRRQMENLFDPDTEVACFRSPEEVPEMVDRYLRHPKERAAIASAARTRILAEHTYEHRITSLLTTMKKLFG